MTFYSLLLQASVFAATAPDGANCPTMDALEEYNARRLELQHVDLTSSTISGSSVSGAQAFQGMAGPAAIGWSTSSAQVESDVARQHRIVTGTGRVVTEFDQDGLAIDANAFWTQVGRRNHYEAQCAPLLTSSEYDELLRYRRRRVGMTWAAAGSAVGTAVAGGSVIDSDNSSVAGLGTVAVLLGGSAAIALGATAIVAVRTLRPPAPDIIVCPSYGVIELETEVRAWNRYLRKRLGCR